MNVKYVKHILFWRLKMKNQILDKLLLLILEMSMRISKLVATLNVYNLSNMYPILQMKC
jgi:hypothetical protein